MVIYFIDFTLASSLASSWLVLSGYRLTAPILTRPFASYLIGILPDDRVAILIGGAGWLRIYW